MLGGGGGPPNAARVPKPAWGCAGSLEMSRQVEGWGHQLGPGVSRLAAPAGVLKRALGRGGGGAQLGGATTCCAFPQFRSVLGVEGPPNAESRSTLEVAGRPPTTAPATGSGLGVEVGHQRLCLPAGRGMLRLLC